MSTATLSRQVMRLKQTLTRRKETALPLLARVRADPAAILAEARLPPDPWQMKLLRSPASRTLLLCSRQAGKSTVAAGLALLGVLLESRSLALLLSPSVRQSNELLRKAMQMFGLLGRPLGVIYESLSRVEFTNGSQILSLPSTEETIRGYSGVTLLVIDEAARVPDPLYYAVRPMLAVSRGRLIALSTPFGKRGFFYEAWIGSDAWARIRIDAHQCPRITPEFLEEERRAIGERWFRQEYSCSFEDVIGAVFSQADIDAAMVDGLQPWVIT